MTLAFENDTRKVIRRLARRSMQADRRRSLFIILTISLAVCLMGMLGFIQSARKMQTREDIQGHYQAGCIGTLEEIRSWPLPANLKNGDTPLTVPESATGTAICRLLSWIRG